MVRKGSARKSAACVVRKGDVVWVPWGRMMWPALVRNIYPNKRITYVFFPDPTKASTTFSCNANSVYALSTSDAVLWKKNDMKEAFHDALQFLTASKMDKNSDAPPFSLYVERKGKKRAESSSSFSQEDAEKNGDKETKEEEEEQVDSVNRVNSESGEGIEEEMKEEDEENEIEMEKEEEKDEYEEFEEEREEEEEGTEGEEPYKEAIEHKVAPIVVANQVMSECFAVTEEPPSYEPPKWSSFTMTVETSSILTDAQTEFLIEHLINQSSVRQPSLSSAAHIHRAICTFLPRVVDKLRENKEAAQLAEAQLAAASKARRRK